MYANEPATSNNSLALFGGSLSGRVEFTYVYNVIAEVPFHVGIH